MSIHVIKIPDIGEGIAEVELVEWHVKVGDAVHQDQNVASVMTDKVSVEISAPIAGTVLSMEGAAGDILRVGADLIRIQPVDEAAVQAALQEQEVSEAIAPDVTESTETHQVPPAVQTTEVHNEAVKAVGESTHHELIKGVLASPAVRKRVADLGFKLGDVATAMGVERVTHNDVDKYLLAQQRSTSSYAPSTTTAQQTGVQSSTFNQDESVIENPVRGIRRQIAQKMERSSRDIPHFSYVEAVDLTELEQLRATLNTKWAAQREHLTLLPFLVKAMCLSLKVHPRLNARFDSENYVVHEYSDRNIGIAVQTSTGLMVPVLHRAQTLTLWEMAAKIKQLSQAAREGTLKREEATGSTISLSSLGRLGGIAATPIINAPELAIIGVNKMVEQPVVINGAMVIRKIMNLSSSFDHRIIDGYDAASFIQTMKTYLEQPALLFIE